MRNKIIYFLTAISLFFGLNGCDDFGNVNNDPQHIKGEEMKYEILLTGAQVFVAGRDWAAWRNNLIYCSTMMQHLASTQGYWNGDKYTYNSGYNAAYFDSYDSGIKKLMEAYYAFKDNPDKIREFQITRVTRVLLMHRMTDMYGDVPYSEAGLGVITGIKYPKYDSQESIYMDMLKELEESAQIFHEIAQDKNEINKIGKADIIHEGNAQRWEKTAYSLMLRLGMRLSKVNPIEAEKWVKKAFAGNLIDNNDENCIIKHDATTDDAADATGKVLCHLDPNAYRVSQTFIDHLKNTGDPRLTYIATVCVNPQYGVLKSEYEFGDTTAITQLGLPNGYDELGPKSLTDVTKAPNWPEHDYYINEKGDTIITRNGMTKYSVVNRYTYAKLEAPTLVVTYAENQLLLAEAAYRGWITGDAKSYYEEGIRAAMEQFTLYGVSGIRPDQIDSYLSNPVNQYNPADALNLINTQYWITTFLDEYESWANWRRSGYPILKEVNYYGNATNGTIPRRFTYATSEVIVNSANYLEAVSKLQDGDKMTSRVWWDKE